MPFVVFAVLASIGFVSTAMADIGVRTKVNLLTAQACVDAIFGFLIAYLCKNCMGRWAWGLVALLLISPVF